MRAILAILVSVFTISAVAQTETKEIKDIQYGVKIEKDISSTVPVYQIYVIENGVQRLMKANVTMFDLQNGVSTYYDEKQEGTWGATIATGGTAVVALVLAARAGWITPKITGFILKEMDSAGVGAGLGMLVGIPGGLTELSVRLWVVGTAGALSGNVAGNYLFPADANPDVENLLRKSSSTVFEFDSNRRLKQFISVLNEVL